MVCEKEERRLLVVPVLAMPGSPATVEGARNRLGQEGDGPPTAQRRIIVIPSQGRNADLTRSEDADPMVVKLHHFEDLL